MKSGFLIGCCAAMLVLASLLGAVAMAETPTHLPAEVKARIAELDKECSANKRGNIVTDNGYLLSADFNADGKTDYVLFQGRIGCTNWNAVFGEADGSAIEAFVSTPDGKHKHDVLLLAQNMRVNATASPATLEIARINRDRWAYDTLTYAYLAGKWELASSRPALADEWPS